VAENRQFEALGQQFEAVAQVLRKCADPKERRELLRRMKLVIDKVDERIRSVFDIWKVGQ
jgi:hypothetical protein